MITLGALSKTALRRGVAAEQAEVHPLWRAEARGVASDRVSVHAAAAAGAVV